ncbi:DUF916 and DUF3324 domain-containing protein [Candidatus Enterococcus ikei]|uniref:DUF916 and DUF3324 domain-containing protein n=1 Tax=Candidatus Enterococcus ikei TaxID=2815326 RepID=A0ABS3GX78_9ENTE|nr:DUF916 and DUF3324 domain-containing protein [Enterococcus sp. DIV0869a]MBO0439872.1 DUF916 and DUF3324 domain-containing protein [Enterococcus sp. DIV0869a]
MNKKKTHFFKFVLYISLLLIPSTNAFATEKIKGTDQEAKGGFSFETVKSEKQVSDANYFDLKLSPGEKHKVQIKLNNAEEKPIDILISLNGAKTNSNGVIEYGPTTIEDDASLKYKFTDIVKGPEEVTIPAKSSIDVDYEITMPATEFDGQIVGGFQIQVKPNEEEEKKADGAVINRYAYVVAMVLKENDTEVMPNLKLNKVHPELRNFRNSIFINYSNEKPAFLEEMTLETQITKKGSKEVLYDSKQAGMRMAPNTMINYAVSMNGEKMIPGDYQAHIKVTARGDKKWEWLEDFKITDEDADKFNDQDVSLLQEASFDWKLIAMCVGGVVTLGLIVFFAIRAFNKKSGKGKRKNSSKANKKK